MKKMRKGEAKMVVRDVGGSDGQRMSEVGEER